MKCVLTSKRSFHCILPMIENDFPCKGFTRGWVDRLVNRWKDFWDWWILPPIVSLIDPHHDKLFQSQGYKKVFTRTFNFISVTTEKGTFLTFHSHIKRKTNSISSNDIIKFDSYWYIQSYALKQVFYLRWVGSLCAWIACQIHTSRIYFWWPWKGPAPLTYIIKLWNIWVQWPS